MSTNNIPSVTVETFTKIIEMQFQERNFRPIFGLGKGGIGKTESIYDLTKKLGIGYVDVRLLLYSETDLKGIPYPNENHTKTVWLQNDILPTVEKNGDKGILVFDEITSCARSVRTAAYQLLNERRLGEYVLPDGWMMVCLGNGEDDGGDYQGMEGNFANRCAVFNVVHDLDAWKLWALNKGVHELVTAYVSFKPSDLHSYNPESETELLFASPRSWTAVSDILNTYGYIENDAILSNRIIANLGQRVGQQFLAFCKFKNATVDPMVIVRDGKIPSLNSDQKEVVYILIESTIRIISDLIRNDMQAYNNSVQQQTIKYMSNVIRWMLKLPKKEYTVMALKDMMTTSVNGDESVMRKLFVTPEIRQECPELLEFLRENQGIYR